MYTQHFKLRRKSEAHHALLLLMLGNAFAALLELATAQMEVGELCETNLYKGICTESSKCMDLPYSMAQLSLKRREIGRCGFTTFEEIICCPTLSVPTTTIKTRADDRPAVKACIEIDEQLQPLLTPHILGGTPVTLGEYPHMVAIGYNNTDDIVEYNCGGTLISKRYVLTAAHCIVTQQRPVIVRMGVVNFTDVEQMKSVVEIKVKNYHVHPEYTSASVYNDVGLLELQEEVDYSINVFPTCLYTDSKDPPNNAPLYVTGWGVINRNTRQKSSVLLKARQTIVDNPTCHELYVANQLTRRNKDGIIASQMCAHDPGLTKDACQGDSGGPLNLVVDEALNKYRVVGVISAGFSCGSATPGLYSRVSAFLDWIESVVWP